MSTPKEDTGRREFLKKGLLGLVAGTSLLTTKDTTAAEPTPTKVKPTATTYADSSSVSTTVNPILSRETHGGSDWSCMETIYKDGSRSLEYKLPPSYRKGEAQRVADARHPSSCPGW